MCNITNLIKQSIYFAHCNLFFIFISACSSDDLKNEMVLRVFERCGESSSRVLVKRHMVAKGLKLPSDKAVDSSVERCVKEMKRLNKNRKTNKEAVDTFKNSDFVFPKSRGSHNRKRSYSDLSQQSKEMEILVYRDVASALATEASTLAMEVKDTKEQLESTKGLNESLTELNQNLGKKEKKLKLQLDNKENREQKQTTQIKELKGTIHTLKNENKILERQKKNLNETLADIRKDLKNTKAREADLRCRNDKLETKIKAKDGELEKALDDYHDVCKKLASAEGEVKELVHENENLTGIIQEMTTETVNTFDGHKYMPQVQKCVFSLLEERVGAAHVAPVITEVLSMVDKKAERLPAASTVHDMNLQRLALSQRQVGETIPKKKSTCLMTDETSKLDRKIMGYHNRDDEGNVMVMGLRDIPSKSAKHSLETFKSILSDIDSRCEDANNKVSKEILENIFCTMSDSASTEKKFNDLLAEYKDTVSPYIRENLQNLSDAETEPVERLMCFFCGLHSLVHFAEITAASCREAEKAEFNGKPPVYDPSFVSEAGVVGLIQRVCKVVARGADEKCGQHGQFKRFISEKLSSFDMKSVPFERYNHSRFNNIYHNASVTYFFHQDLLEFLGSISGNRLTKHALHDLGVEFYVGEVKALGLLSKQITTPLWNVLEDKNIHVLDMNKHYLNLLNALREATQDVDSFMRGEILPFKMKADDKIYDHLLTPSDYDKGCRAALEIILPALAAYVTKHFADSLPGGKYSTFTEEMYQKSKCVEKHNKYSEYVFGLYDQIIQVKPNISTLAAEAYIMFACNKTR